MRKRLENITAQLNELKDDIATNRDEGKEMKDGLIERGETRTRGNKNWHV